MEGGVAAAAVDIDSMLNPELAAERRARQRHSHQRDDVQSGAADIKGFEVRYDVRPVLVLRLHFFFVFSLAAYECWF